MIEWLVQLGLHHQHLLTAHANSSTRDGLQKSAANEDRTRHLVHPVAHSPMLPAAPAASDTPALQSAGHPVHTGTS